MNLLNMSFRGVDSPPAPTQPKCSGVRRRPLVWIVVWATYSLLALGYFGYRSAWLGAVCIDRQ